MTAIVLKGDVVYINHIISISEIKPHLGENLFKVYTAKVDYYFYSKDKDELIRKRNKLMSKLQTQFLDEIE